MALATRSGNCVSSSVTTSAPWAARQHGHFTHEATSASWVRLDRGSVSDPSTALGCFCTRPSKREAGSLCEPEDRPTQPRLQTLLNSHAPPFTLSHTLTLTHPHKPPTVELQLGRPLPGQMAGTHPGHTRGAARNPVLCGLTLRPGPSEKPLIKGRCSLLLMLIRS